MKKYIIINTLNKNYPYLKEGTIFTWMFKSVKIFDTFDDANKTCFYAHKYLPSNNRVLEVRDYNTYLRKEKLEEISKI